MIFSKLNKLSILLVAFVFVAQNVTGQTLPNDQAWDSTKVKVTTLNSDSSGYLYIGQIRNALKINMNQVLNVPVTDRIIYSNGTNLTSNAGLTYSGSSLGVTGTGIFTGTVSGANAASAGQFTTLSQLQSSISGTSGFYAKFTGVNTVGNGLLQDVSTTHFKTSGKPYLNEYTANSCTYRDLMYLDNNSASVTGALVIETGITNLIADKMVAITIKGYNFSSYGAYDVRIGGYTYNTTIDTWFNPSAEIIGNAPFSVVQLAHNVVTGKYVIILGTVSTVWAYPKIHVSEMLAAYLTGTNTLATGLTSSFVTDLSPYTGVVTPSLQKKFSNYGAGSYTGTNAKSLNVTSGGFVVEGMPMPTTALTVNQIPYSNGTTFIGGTGLTYTGSAFNVTGTGTFSGIVTAADATAATHLVNRQTGDVRYLGISATATNSNAVMGQDTSNIGLRNAVQTFTQRVTFQKNTPVGDAVNDGDAMSKYLVENRVGKNSDTITLYNNRAAIQLTPYSSLIVFSARVGSVNWNTTINLDPPADNNMHSWQIMNTQLLSSGAKFTINAPSGYTFSFNLSSSQFVAQYDPTSTIGDQDIDFTSANFSIQCTAEKKSQKCRCWVQSQ